MVTTFYPPYSFGGDAIYIYRLSNELARRGHPVDVIHCEDSFQLLQKNGLKGDFPNHSNVKVHRLKSRMGLLSPLLTQQTGVPFFKKSSIRQMLENNQYDVIHFHNMSLIGITALQYGKGIKLYTTHEHWLICPMHVLWKYDREVCTRKSCISCSIIGKRPPQFWRYTDLLQKMLPHVDRFISPSRFTLRKHLEDGLKIPITHIPYFLAKDEEESENNVSRDLATPGSRPYFLFVGRLERIKGVQNLIPVFRKHAEFDLWIAGEGNYGDMLRTSAAGAANIRFLGKLSHQELKKLYRNAIAVIVPSICYEVFGIIIIESFATKTPVIANNLGALPEVIEESGGGFVYNSEEELVAAMKKLAGDGELRNDLGEKGYRSYLKYWTEESHMEQYLNLVRELQNERLTRRAGEQ